MGSISNIYPPMVSQERFSRLVFDIKDWQITHGMLLKYGPDAKSVSSIPVGVSLFPTPFPRQLFERAQRLQILYNRLYAAISEDEEWLERVLRGYVSYHDPPLKAMVSSRRRLTGWTDSSTVEALLLCFGTSTKRSRKKAVHR